MRSEKENEKKRKRYAEDPEYRNKIIAAARTYRAENKDEIKVRREEKRRSDPEAGEKERRRIQVRNLRVRYKIAGMTLEKFELMLARQRGACKICRRVRPSETLCIDHRHATGWVRALLCRKCNLGLGAYDDNPYWLVRAAAYLVLSLIQEMASRLLVRVASLCRRAAAAATKLMSRIGRICVTLAANTGRSISGG